MLNLDETCRKKYPSLRNGTQSYVTPDRSGKGYVVSSYPRLEHLGTLDVFRSAERRAQHLKAQKLNAENTEPYYRLSNPEPCIGPSDAILACVSCSFGLLKFHVWGRWRGLKQPVLSRVSTSSAADRRVRLGDKVITQLRLLSASLKYARPKL